MVQFIACFLIVCSFSVHCSNSVSGTFEAKQSCPAYLSKNSKSNPGNISVEVNQRYTLKEINKSPPTWLRIELPERGHGLRWVDANCGVVDYQERDSSRCDGNPGMADSYVLALSSQPGFCQTYGYEAGKPECVKLGKNSYQASHLTLHGLWPNQDACGQRYGYCGVKPRSNHCDYSPLNLSEVVGTDLKKFMPSYNYGSCLERHEWNKHGSCQVLSNDNYFSLAMRLTNEADQTEFGAYLTQHKGDTVKLSTLRGLIGKSLGEKNAGKVYLGCKNGTLVDIFIVLPALIPFNESLATLVNKAPDYKYNDACSNYVTISDFSRESWY